MNKSLCEKILTEKDLFFMVYFNRSKDSSIYLRCYIPELIPGGPFWNPNKSIYSIPIEVEDYRINSNGRAFKFLDEETKVKRMEEYATSTNSIKEIILTNNLNLWKGKRFEVLANGIRQDARGRHITLVYGDIDKVIVEY